MMVIKSGYTVMLESFNSLASYWPYPRSPLRWDCIFVLPPWLEVWWQKFGPMADLYLCAVKQKETIIGIAPLLLKGQEASFMGSDNVCDYLDFVISPGNEHEFFTILLDDLRKKGISRLSLRLLKPNSSVLTHLVGIAKTRRCDVSCKMEDVSLELELPLTWEAYLKILNRKQRHEVRRKLRRIREIGEVKYRIIDDSEAVLDTIDFFIKLFRKTNTDKMLFMTTEMESFLISLSKAMAGVHLLKIGILDIDSKPVAAIIYFDYDNIVYLYNSAYDPHHSSLSVGLISKIHCIKNSIESGKMRFDFLKGAEEYKYRLGGKEIPLYGCQIVLK
jgi:CelD/BcsL family acetyltransferase involved in cellulose biosynthesis